MSLSRREFFATGGIAMAATLVPGRLVAALEAQAPAAPESWAWRDVRSQFSLARDYLHFSSFFIASHPKPVRDAIESYRRVIDDNPFLTVERGMFEAEHENLQRKVRQEMSGYLGAQPDEIALTGNTTTSLALVYAGLPLRPGDEVLVTTHDHFVHHESIRLAVARAGATMRKIPLFERASEATAASIVERLRDGIRPETRAVGVTWVHSSTGMRLPIGEIAAAVRQANRGRDERDRALLVVDGVHGLGAVDEVVAGMGCDFFCAGTHKWMFAPRGTGIIWARAENWARLVPTVPSFSAEDVLQAWMNEQPPAGPTTAARVTPGGFTAFEHQWAMGAAFRFHQQIGRARGAERIRALNDQLKDGLARMEKVKLHTPRDPALSAGIVCFEVDGLTTEEVVKGLLERRVIASSSPYRVSYPRLAPSLVNDPAEVDRALEAVREVAGA